MDRKKTGRKIKHKVALLPAIIAALGVIIAAIIGIIPTLINNRTPPSPTPTPTSRATVTPTPTPEATLVFFENPYYVDNVAPMDDQNMNNGGNGAEIQNDERWTRYWKAYGNSQTSNRSSFDELLDIDRSNPGVPRLSPNTSWVYWNRIRSTRKTSEGEALLVKPYLFRLTNIQGEEVAYQLDFKLDDENTRFTLVNGVYETGVKNYIHKSGKESSFRSPYEEGLGAKYQYVKNAVHAIFISYEGDANKQYQIEWFDQNNKEVSAVQFKGVRLDPTGSETFVSGLQGESFFDSAEWNAAPSGSEKRDINNCFVIIPRDFRGWLRITTPLLGSGETTFIWDGTVVFSDKHIEDINAIQNNNDILAPFVIEHGEEVELVKLNWN